MEQITLKIESIQPATRKDKSTVEGVGNKGQHWQLFRINERYSYFHNGEGIPGFTLGQEYSFDLETKKEGEYTNYKISLPRQVTTPPKPQETPETPKSPETKPMYMTQKQGEEIIDLLKNIESKIISRDLPME